MRNLVQDRQPHRCGYRAYMDIFTVCLEQGFPFISAVVSIKIKIYRNNLLLKHHINLLQCVIHRHNGFLHRLSP